MRLRPLFLLAPALLLACGKGDRPPAADSTGAAPAADPVIAGADGTYDLQLPTRWVGHYYIDTLSAQETGLAHPGAWEFLYRPVDSAIRPQVLLVVAVYDSAAWRKALAEGGPPPGDSVAARSGLVYVLGLPQSNPFPFGADSTVFELLQLKRAEMGSVVRPKP